MSCKVAILGSGNIGTDLMMKVAARSDVLEMAAMGGIDPKSEGLRRAREMGVATTTEGVEGLARLSCFDEIEIVFDATSAGAHRHNDAVLQRHGKRVVDLTPAALGPYVVPVVNAEIGTEVTNVNMVSCGGQATIPIVAAVSRAAPVRYAEIVASISSRSAGPGTRANIDEFTQTTAKGLEVVGGAKRGKAVIILNPADPPLLMRDTIYCLSDDGDEDAVAASVESMIQEVQRYVPGYRLKQTVQFERISPDRSVPIPGLGTVSGLKTSVFIEVEGAGDYLPKYAGNLDIMTSAAVATAETLTTFQPRERRIAQ